MITKLKEQGMKRYIATVQLRENSNGSTHYETKGFQLRVKDIATARSEANSLVRDLNLQHHKPDYPERLSNGELERPYATLVTLTEVRMPSRTA